MCCKRKFRAVLIAGLFTLVPVCLVGCGNAGTVSGVTVKGKVLYNDKPLSTAGATTAVVVFMPDNKKGNTFAHGARGNIEADGSYTLTSDLPGQQGLPAGTYKVSVVVQKKNAKEEYGTPTSLIPSRYANPVTAGLKVVVEDNAPPNRYNIKLYP